MTKMNDTKNNKVILRLHMEQNALFYKRFRLFWRVSLKAHQYNTSSIDFHLTAHLKI